MRLFLFCVALMLPAAAQAADPGCAPRSEVLAQLLAKYQEAPVERGLRTKQGTMIEVIASADGATWTIIESSPEGVSCLRAAGEGWQVLKPALEAPGSPS